MSSKTKAPVLSDLLEYEAHPRFCRESGTLENNTGAPVTIAAEDILGMPVKLVSGQWEIALNADVATIDGILLEGPAITALADGSATTDKYSILARGPAVVTEDQLADDDPAGTTWTSATLLATLAAIDIIARSLPATYESQTT